MSGVEESWKDSPAGTWVMQATEKNVCVSDDSRAAGAKRGCRLPKDRVYRIADRIRIGLWICAGWVLLLPWAAKAVGDYGPETCKEGFVWREACGPNDHVCVSAATRARAAQDNSQADARREPNGGPFGPDTCRAGFVWREACGPQDHVCVTPQTRRQAAADDAAAESRFKKRPILWDVLTQHNDAARSGTQPHETALKPSNVKASRFGRLYERHVEGQIIAQPLYVSNQRLPGKGLRNVVYVATRKNWIYAFDADDLNSDPEKGLIWKTQIEPAGDVPNMCTETRGPMGITSTPVIDRRADTMYVVARSTDGAIWLHAVDIATGQPKKGTPGRVRVKAIAAGIKFQEDLELNRAALLMVDGAIYMGFSALNCDNAGWRGWILGYRAPDLEQVGVFLTSSSPDGWGAGVWQSGNGLVADSSGSLYFETGNGLVRGDTDLGESFVKLKLGAPPRYGLTLAGHYPVTNHEALNGGDTDLGSGGPLLLPGNLLAGGGKQGKLYVLNTKTLQPAQNGPGGGPLPPGGSDGFQAFVNTWHDDSTQVSCTYGPKVGILERQCFMPHPIYEEGEAWGPNIHTGPITWRGPAAGFSLVYAMPEKDHLKAFKLNEVKRHLETTASAKSELRSPDGMPGTFLSLSANVNADGIIWASMPKYDGQYQNVPGRLVAFDAVSLKELWRDDDDVGFAKFNPPTVAGGKVFRPTFADKLIVYGLRKDPPAPACHTIAEKYENFTGPEGILGTATGPETASTDGVGRYRHFQGGSIYWTPSTCAYEVHGSIHGEWSALGFETGLLGYPMTDETVTPDGIGRYNHFQSGSIYWTPLSGAHEVHGLIRERWASLGWEQSALGYPISDETDEPDGSGRFSLFEHGVIHWNRATNVVTVRSEAGQLVGPAQDGTDRPGADVDNFDLPAPNPTMCQESCAGNAQCRAWAYVKPSSTQPNPHCWLKSAIPLPQPANCCVSGVRVAIHPSNMHPMDGTFDRFGADFAGFGLPDADPRLCQGECALNGTCRAWAYVEPNTFKGPDPQCFLKTSVPAQVPNQYVVSGTKK
jgi:hypothetical protein